MLNFAEEFRRENNYPENLLDIGCGPCLEGEQLLAHGISLTGVDQDGETILEVQKRLPGGKFVTADAAIWLQKADTRFDAILIRRPDLIFRSENWHSVFRMIPLVLKPDGRVVVTTPGQSEAGMCAEWLRETAEKVSVSRTGISEEAFLVKADDFREKEKEKEEPSGVNRLIQDLSWEDDQPYMVCDLRTGQCTVVTDKEDNTNEKE
jgi:trans-aconitate methyltransferase